VCAQKLSDDDDEDDGSDGGGDGGGAGAPKRPPTYDSKPSSAVDNPISGKDAFPDCLLPFASKYLVHTTDARHADMLEQIRNGLSWCNHNPSIAYDMSVVSKALDFCPPVADTVMFKGRPINTMTMREVLKTTVPLLLKHDPYTPHKLGFNPEAMDFREVSDFDIVEICMWSGLMYYGIAQSPNKPYPHYRLPILGLQFPAGACRCRARRACRRRAPNTNTHTRAHTHTRSAHHRR